jgi:hypothetical protein
LAKGEEELSFTHKDKAVEDMIEECGKFNPNNDLDNMPSQPDNQPKEPKVNSGEQSYNDFLALDPKLQATAKSFTYQFGKEDKDKIIWTILLPEEQITECPLDALHATEEEADDNKDPVLKDELPWDPNPSKVDYNKLLLENFFPCPMGIAKTLDDFLCRPAKDPKLPNEWKARVERDKILFHREGDYDPDKLVSCGVCYYLIYCTPSLTKYNIRAGEDVPHTDGSICVGGAFRY